jgi:lactate permease
LDHCRWWERALPFTLAFIFYILGWHFAFLFSGWAVVVCAGISITTPKNACSLKEEPVTSPTAPLPKTSATPANAIAWLVAIVAAIVAAVLILRIPSPAHPWPQNYDPTGHWWLSALVATLPVVVLLGSLALLHMKAHYSALLGLATSIICAIWFFGMPAVLAAKTAVLGAGYGLLPIGWIILNVIFMYQLTCEAGLFKVLQESLTGITQDRRLQLLLIAFSFGAFFEGAAGFGTPVAVTAAVLIGLGFKPLEASGLSLIANTAPVAYGAIGTPLIALQGVTGLDLLQLSAQAGRILPFFSVLVPFWLIWAFAGFAGMLEVWPAALVAGIFFAIPQFLMSNFHGPWLVDVVAAVISMAALTLFLMKWQPKRIWGFEHEGVREARGTHGHSRAQVVRAWVPWLVLSVLVFLWGLPTVKIALDKVSAPKLYASPRPKEQSIR